MTLDPEQLRHAMRAWTVVGSPAAAIPFAVSNTGGGTMNWTAEVISGGSWLSIEQGLSGSNSGTILAGFTANIVPTQRVGTIRVTAEGATGSPMDVTVTQAGTPVSLVLQAQRLVTRAWIIRGEYARLDLTVAKPSHVHVDHYVLLRRVGTQAFQVLREFGDADILDGRWRHLDNNLDRTKAYAYRVEANINAFYDAAQKEQIEKDAKICEQRSDDHAKGKCHSDGIRCSEADYCTEAIRNQLSKEND